MKTQSAKAKGRNLQKWVVNKLIETFEIHPEDIKSCSMGAGGEDVQLSPAARKLFKNQHCPPGTEETTLMLVTVELSVNGYFLLPRHQHCAGNC